MKYFIDCEFNSFGGELLSLALIREDGKSLYLLYPEPEYINTWVLENVIPFMEELPERIERHYLADWQEGAMRIAEFLQEDSGIPHIIADWPDDIKYFCQAVITGPGQMASIPRLAMEVVRVNAWPNNLEGAVQHNAWWDAFALRFLILKKNDYS